MLNREKLKQKVLDVYEECKNDPDDNYSAPTSSASRDGALKFVDILCDMIGENDIEMPSVCPSREDLSFDWSKEASDTGLHRSLLSIDVDADSMVYVWVSDKNDKFCGQVKLTDKFPVEVLKVLLEELKVTN